MQKLLRLPEAPRPRRLADFGFWSAPLTGGWAMPRG